MSYDAHANFVISSIAAAPSPAGSGTSLTVLAGQGTLFPAAPFNATVWPTGQSATFVNAEIVRVTNVTGDVLTIVRTQEGTNARTILVGDLIANTITAKVITDIEAPRLIPAQHSDIPGGATTTSAVLVDIPSSSISLTNTVSCGLLAWLTVEIQPSTGGTNIVGITINIDGVDSDETQYGLTNINLPVSLSKNEASGITLITPLGPGPHTVKARWRRVSGVGTLTVNSGEITAMFLQVL